MMMCVKSSELKNILLICLLSFQYAVCCENVLDGDEEFLLQEAAPRRYLIVNYCPVHYANSTKQCNLRGDIYKQKWYTLEVGFNCYFYTNPERFEAQFQLQGKVVFACENEMPYLIDVTMLPDKRIFWFDYKNDTATKIIKDTFKSEEYYNLWLDCCQDAEKCCNDVMTNSNIKRSPEYCPATWDAWTCFEPAKVGTVARKACSTQAYSSPPLCELQSEKECFSNGTWNPKTDYSTCSITPFRINRLEFHVAILAVSSSVCLPAAIIFLAFRKFRRTTRIVLHRNLIIAIIVRNILSIMTEEIIILDSLQPLNETNHVMVDNSVGCRILAFFEGAAKNAMYACMMVDGFYLHKLIVRSFADEPNIYILYGVVAGFTFIPSLIWAICNTAKEAENCWMVDIGYQPIIDSFRIAIIVINVLLLLDIVRSIIGKLKYSSSSKQTRATLNATLFLIPLFGLHILFIMYRGILQDNRCQTQDIYYYISYSMEGLQGVMVSILFCYINNEVHKELSNSYRKCAIYLQQRYNLSLPKSEFNRRRTTATTIVASETNAGRRSTSNIHSLNNSNINQFNTNGNNNIIDQTIPELEEEGEGVKDECEIKESNVNQRRITVSILNDTGSTDL